MEKIEILSVCVEPLVLIGFGLFVAGTLLLDYNQNANRVRQALLQLMLQAEKLATKGEYGAYQGSELMDLVVKKAVETVVPMLPFYMRPFFTERAVRDMAEFVYEKAYDYLDDGKLNRSFVLDKQEKAE